MDWNGQIALITDAKFPQQNGLLRLVSARILLRITDVDMTAAPPMQQDVIGILSNARATADAAYELWRRGLLLQTGTLLRTVIEASALAIVLHDNPDVHTRFRNRRFSSTKALQRAKHLLGTVGDDLVAQYGELSQRCVHIGPWYRRLLTWHVDLRNDLLPLQVLLIDLKLTYHLLELCTEFTLYDTIKTPLYWRRKANRLVYDPTEEATRWLATYIERDLAQLHELAARALNTNTPRD